MTRLTALILSLALAVPAWAEWPYDAVVKVHNGRYGGSGTLVGVAGETGLVVSCGHLFETGVQQPWVEFTNGGKCGARVLGMDGRSDLSALAVKVPTGIETPRSVRSARKDDGPFVCVGFPWYGQGKQHWTRGELYGLTNDSQAHVRCSVQSGYSGGALFNRYGDFCGVVCGMTDAGGGRGVDRTYCPSGEALLRFVGRWMEVER